MLSKSHSTDLIGLDWIYYFDYYTKYRFTRKNKSRLLLFDGHRFYLIYKFFQFCSQNYIISYCFFFYTTYIIQLLDSQLFQVYKHYYRDRNNYLASLGVETDNKAAFLKKIPAVRKKIFKLYTVKDAFKKRGIYLFNSEEVMKPLYKTKSSISEIEIFTTLLSLLSSFLSLSTIQDLRRSIGKVQDFIDNSPELNQSFVQYLDYIFQSFLETAELAG